MFLVRYFKYGLMLPKLLTRRGESLLKVFIYFILLTFIMNFPLTWLAFENNGTKLNFINENLTSNNPDWYNLPTGTFHPLQGFSSTATTNVVVENLDYVYIFNVEDSYEIIKDKHNIVFTKSNITYIDKTGSQLITNGYSGFKTTFNLNELNFSSGEERQVLFETLGSSIETSFSTYIVLYTTIRNQFVQILANMIFVLVLAGIIQLFRFGFQKFLNFKDGINFVVFASTIPSLLAMVFGLILPGFAPVVYNLVLGMTVMLVLLIFSRKTFS